MSDSVFEPYIQRWHLTPDGAPFASLGGLLLPVHRAGTPAILKISRSPEEVAGGQLMAWWQGDGAAPVLEIEGEALLMVRAQGEASLTQMVRDCRDDDATRILCETVAHLHRPRLAPGPALTPLPEWFHSLLNLPENSPDVLKRSAQTARMLLDTTTHTVVLHGDIHHANVLDFGTRGWLAIDPKGLRGERGFDYANLFCNPDVEMARKPEVFARRVDIVTRTAAIDPRRLLQWVLAWAGLSVVWMLEDDHGQLNGEAEGRLDVARLTAAALDA
ncbi:hypothetical protein PAN31117_04234 [Pandoraea anapnoica]|uniref:3'-kinase n=1 Tax=Pandoraea anapnoica TaxID=2508301 RepID=A0A5E5AE93_9BURK|nr:aminoglycoside phosphotransferase family protein [Pandoraea anapnoica]VVE71981.1 hypothetical protein PAN31117_04234 [Pandoraea anapnoica]